MKTPIPFYIKLRTTWRLLRLSKLIISGVIQAHFYLRNGIHQQPEATSRFLRWNKKICDIFNTRMTCHGDMQTTPTLFVMNHISWFDIPVLACHQPVHFLSKSDVRNWPLIGWLADRAGTLFIERGTHGAAQKSLEEIIDCLETGGSVVIFPEGTTTDGTGVKKFHGRLLQAAIDTGINIQPIALRYPYKQGINPHVPYIDDMSFIDSVIGLSKIKPVEVELHFLNPITEHLDQMNNTDINSKQLAKIAHSKIAEKLQSLEN